MSEETETPRAKQVALLRTVLQNRIAPDALAWIDAARAKVAVADEPRTLYMAFSAAGRRTGKEPLKPTPDERAAAGAGRADWDLSSWTVDQAARVLLLLELRAESGDALTARLDPLFQSADLGELQALCKSLPLLPFPEAHRARCADIVRTNITSVFEAVAHENPYPTEQLDEGAWNQMVLKALFIGVKLYPIQGIDERANPELARILCDYAHERWAAGRKISPELWRCVGPFADDGMLADLERAVSDDDGPGALGALLALKTCPHDGAAPLREAAPLPAGLLADGDWKHLGDLQ
ncbi:MAG: EboA domain-containing protein [Planctomycetota bacterium]